MGRVEAVLVRADAGLFALVFLIALSAGPALARTNGFHAVSPSSFSSSCASRMQSGLAAAPGQDLGRRAVETIRRMSRVFALRTTDTQFVIKAGGNPAVPAKIAANVPLGALAGRVIETRGSGAQVRAPPSATGIL